jgi:hypothetical protein
VETGSWIAGSKAVESLKLIIHFHGIQRPRMHGTLPPHCYMPTCCGACHRYNFTFSYFMVYDFMFILNYCIYIRGKDIIAGYSNYRSILQMLGFMPLLFGMIKLCFLKI